MDDKLSLTLSVQQWNTIMGLLGQQPYVAVQPLINEIQQQVAARNAVQRTGSALAQENRDAVYNHTVVDHPHGHSIGNGHAGDFVVPDGPPAG